MSTTSPDDHGIEFDVAISALSIFHILATLSEIKDLTNFVINFIFALNDLIFLF